MTQFDYESVLPALMTPAVSSALATIREYRGRQAAYGEMNPDVLESLVEVAKIQSIGASNRIENIATSERRLREIVSENTAPRNRDEREIAGYRYVLELIHENHDAIPVTPGVILQLHRDLYRYSDVAYAGRWKDADNVIAERAADGTMVTRFQPTSAAATPGTVERLCEAYAACIDAGVYDPLLVSALFVFDFVSIHPFNDGNGRMSRLLTLLLMYRNGYTVGKYVSIEKEIERSKATYYEALQASSCGWHDGTNDYMPFVTYFLGVVTACCKELDERIVALATTRDGESLLRNYFANLTGNATKRQVMDANPTVSQRTVERVLQKLQQEGSIEKVGAARTTAYRRKG